MARMPGAPFRPPKSWTSGRPAGPPKLIVFHYTAGSEGVTAAEDGVAYDARRTDGTSAHFYVDRDSVIQSVDTGNRAHTALYYGNLYGIHIEMCGTRQTREQWLDAASRETIRNAAKVAAWAMTTHGIPLAKLVTRQVRTGKGLCGHYDITYGFTEDKGTHEDPEPGFPWDVLVADIRAELGDDDMTPEQATKLDQVHGWLQGGAPFKDNDPETSPVWLVRAIGATQKLIAKLALAEDEDNTQILAAVQAMAVNDVEGIADAVVGKLGTQQAGVLLDALRDRLAG